MTAEIERPEPANGWLLYDADCGVCRWLARLSRGFLRRRGIELEALGAPWVGGMLSLPPDELLRDVRLVLRDGRQLRGTDVYRYVLHQVYWLRPLCVLSKLPLIRQVFDGSYRWFADNRSHLFPACRPEGRVAAERA